MNNKDVYIYCGRFVLHGCFGLEGWHWILGNLSEDEHITTVEPR